LSDKLSILFELHHARQFRRHFLLFIVKPVTSIAISEISHWLWFPSLRLQQRSGMLCAMWDIHTWPMPLLSRWLERRRHENILRKVLMQHNCEYRQCTTQELSFQWHRRSPGQRFV